MSLFRENKHEKSSLTFPQKTHTLKLSRKVCGNAFMAEKKTTINLLARDSESFMTQFFDWALTIGRLLIILIQTVALATFIYRFSLDMQLVNYHDKIKSESFILDNFQSAETTFVDIQDRLATVQKYSTVENRTASIFTDITKMGQDKVTFKDLAVNTQTVTVEVQAQSSASLAEFVNSLKHYPLVTSVSVDKVAISPSSALISVVITATFKHAQFAQTEQEVANSINQSILNSQ